MQETNVETFLVLLLTLVAAAYVLGQARRPTRWVGQLFLWAMNLSHARVTDWGLAQIQIEKRSTILDVGCGGGRTIQRLATMAPDGRLYGVDYAAGSVAAARRANATLIQAGRAGILQASVSALPFPEDSFDLATAVETQYYWPDLLKDMQEIRRVLIPGGRLVVIVEIYKGSRSDPLERLVMRLLRAKLQSVDEQRDLFTAAGYSDVQMFEARDTGWLCAVGRKPA